MFLETETEDKINARTISQEPKVGSRVAERQAFLKREWSGIILKEAGAESWEPVKKGVPAP